MKKIILLLLLFALTPITVFGLEDCPFGEVNDPYPEKCASYLDTDGNAICDHSESLSESKENIIPITIEKEESNTGNVYHLIPISVPLIILFLITRALSKKKILRVITHKKIWNVFLLITFLSSGILGILLIIKINFNLPILPSFNMLFWHVEIGIAIFTICVLHIIERWYFFKNIFKM